MAGPKLLDKKIVQATLAHERKLEIDKGIKLAKSIDVLRETKVKEEQELERFRTETVQRVQVEIDALIQERDRLKAEINTLQAYGRS